MKLSLAWIFDHLRTSWKEHDIPALMRRFNTTTAEIDACTKVVIDIDSLTIAQVIKTTSQETIFFSPEHKKEYSLPNRTSVQEGQFFLLVKENKTWHWASEKYLGSTKEGLLPAVSISQKDLGGDWKKTFEKEDYILTIDNIALTHRPDLWCHRGVAREIGALLSIELVPEHEFLCDIPVTKAEKEARIDDAFTVELGVSSDVCKRFAAIHVPHIQNQPSSLFITHRLSRIDSKAIDSIVDATNYVMFDVGQPLHAFDAKKITTKKLCVKEAKNGQLVSLLDGQEITLQNRDIILSDGKKPLGLAGIMGGQETAVQETTTELLVEAASFNARAIRVAAAHHKIRTEASTRFEKNIDPQQNVPALLRFLKILSLQSIDYTMPKAVISLGSEVKPHEINVTHTLIERMLGVTITSDFVITTLTKLGFEVKKNHNNQIVEYKVCVPTFRSTKDVLIPQDIVEEVGRYFGFDAIPPLLPALPLRPSNITRFNRTTMIKEYIAFCALAHEVYNYAVFDEEFLKLFSWNPKQSIAIKNPVSSTMYRLVTSLVPNLLKNIYTNATHKDTYNLFEINKIWHKNSDHIREQMSIAGVFFATKQTIDFYEKKEILLGLFKMLGFDVTWQKAQNADAWYHPYQTAELWYNKKLIGYAGIANPTVLNTMVPGSAFIFELDGDILLETEIPVHLFKPLPKYQDAWRDVSMIVPLPVTVEQITNLIATVSPAIVSVELIDFFQKEEWLDKRSITMRFFARNEEKTFITEEIDAVYSAVTQALQNIGATIR